MTKEQLIELLGQYKGVSEGFREAYLKQLMKVRQLVEHYKKVTTQARDNPQAIPTPKALLAGAIAGTSPYVGLYTRRMLSELLSPASVKSAKRWLVAGGPIQLARTVATYLPLAAFLYGIYKAFEYYRRSSNEGS